MTATTTTANKQQTTNKIERNYGKENKEEETDDQKKDAELIKEMSEKWRNMSADEKRPFLEAYEQDRKDYKVIMDAYKKTGVSTGEDLHQQQQPFLSPLRKSRKKTIISLRNK